jgi:hypothetical protein
MLLCQQHDKTQHSCSTAPADVTAHRLHHKSQNPRLTSTAAWHERCMLRIIFTIHKLSRLLQTARLVTVHKNLHSAQRPPHCSYQRAQWRPIAVANGEHTRRWQHCCMPTAQHDRQFGVQPQAAQYVLPRGHVQTISVRQVA